MSTGDQISIQKEPKEEPLDDFPSISPNDEISNGSSAILKEPEENPLVLFRQCSLENEANDNVIKEEEISEHGDVDGNVIKEEEIPPLDDEVLKRTSSSRIVRRPQKYSDYLVDQPVEKHESKIGKRSRIEKSRKNRDKKGTCPNTSKFKDVGDAMSMSHFTMENRSKKKSANNTAGLSKDSSEAVEEEGKRRSSRNVSGSVKYTESTDESDEEYEESFKKKRSESIEKKKKISVVPQMRKSSRNGRSQSTKDKSNRMEKNELKCPECEYCTKNANTWETHLRDKHSTTPALAGYILRCDCGYQSSSYSKRHSYKCETSNYTAIRKGKGPIRRLTDPVMTPQCILCKSGIYLLCSCGIRYNSHHDKKKHRKKCSGRDFTLHKINEN